MTITLLRIGVRLALLGTLLTTIMRAQSAVPDANAISVQLHQAARAGNLILVRALLRREADVDARDAAGRTALMDASAAGQLNVMRLLLASGADVNARSRTGITALIEAAENGRNKSSHILILSGADVNVSSRGLGTALEAAERGGHDAIVTMLRASGAHTSGKSVGDTVCVRPWGGEGYCGTVEAAKKNDYRIRVTEIIGCKNGCPAKSECSAGKMVGGAGGIAIGDEVKTVSWCLTHTGVAQ